MNKGICSVSVAPVRAAASDTAEMVTQLLFGESCDIIEVEDNWTYIRIHWDGYQGWMDTKQLRPVPEALINERRTILLPKPFSVENTAEGQLLLSMGSEIDSEKAQDHQTKLPERKSIVSTARGFLHTPYLWGGRSYFGIDCSGLVQIVFKIHGVKLPRDAYQQAEVGEVLSFVGESKPGDLAFFENEAGKITHVGIMLDDQNIIHAHGKVRIDTLDSVGIYNADLRKHTHKLRFVRRVL